MTHSDRILRVSRCPPCHHNGYISVPSPRPGTSLISQLHSSSSKCHENWQFLIFSRFPDRPLASYYVTLATSQQAPAPARCNLPSADAKSILGLGTQYPRLHYKLSISVSGQLCSIPSIIGDNTEISSPPTQLTGNGISVGNIVSAEDISVCKVVIARVLVRLGGRPELAVAGRLSGTVVRV